MFEWQKFSQKITDVPNYELYYTYTTYCDLIDQGIQ